MRVKTREFALVHLLGLAILSILTADGALSIRLPDHVPVGVNAPSNQPLKTAVFALGSFWRSEAVFGCLNGVVRTTAGYAGGTKPNPEFRNLGDHAESVQIYSSDDAESNDNPTNAEHKNWLKIKKKKRLKRSRRRKKKKKMRRWIRPKKKILEPAWPALFTLLFRSTVQIEYDPKLIHFRQLLEVFWSNHDSRQVFGQGPDVGSQYRSLIFTNGTEEVRLAALSKEREQTKSRSSIVTTEIQQLRTFYPAEPEHQKFELKRHPFLLQLLGNMPEEELATSRMSAKLNGYAAELCPLKSQRQIDAKIDEIRRKGWPLLREV